MTVQTVVKRADNKVVRIALGLLAAFLVISLNMPFGAAEAEPSSPSTNAISFVDEPVGKTPELYQGSFLYTSGEAMLSALGVTVYPEDKWYAFPEPGLGLGSQIKLYRAQPVLIKDGSVDSLVRTWAPTVGDLLAEQGVEVDEKDVVEPNKQSSLNLGEELPVIKITRVAEREAITNSPVAYATQYQDDPELERGVEKTQQAGSNGNLQKVFLVREENGVETSRKLVSQEVTKEAVPEIIKRGTKVVQYGTGGASWYGGVPALTAAHKTLPMGTKVKVVNVSNGKSVIVTIADRGPFVAGRIIDLSQDAFAQIASLGAGVANVRLEKP